MDGGAWWATVHGVARSRRRLSDVCVCVCVCVCRQHVKNDILPCAVLFLQLKSPAHLYLLEESLEIMILSGWAT